MNIMENKGDIDIVKMSEKGQLVVPQDIRELLNLNPGERFAAFPFKEGILFKRIELPKIKLDFEALSKDVEAQFKKNRVKRSDVKEAVKWTGKR
ncbi:MAG: AbrB/MazE/SpoVT family DNA-binding domain-containing protein [Candidatus Woesearchaeota archaeon]